jgi:histidine kinase
MSDIPGYTSATEIHRSHNSIIERAIRRSDGAPVILKRPTEALPGPSRIAQLRREFAMTRQALERGSAPRRVHVMDTK